MTNTLLEPLAPVAHPSASPYADLVVPFSAVTRKDVARVGGKGANLGEMTGLDLPVPPGFILSIDAYRDFQESNGLAPKVAEVLEHVDADDPTALERSSSALRQLIAGGTLSDALRAAVEGGYAALGAGDIDCRVAVRSSATAEDTAQYSFAGMFESFLNVSGTDALVDAVKACWASTFGARVLFYRIKQGLPREMPLAVIVQRMIDSDKSGVIFTSDPATGDTSRIVIEAAWGLGETVVQGTVTPDRHVIDKATLSSIATDVARKDCLLTWDAKTRANVRVDLVGDARATAPVLDAGEVRALGELARRAETHYGAPQDLEFAIEKGRVYLTQSRPITTLLRAKPRAGTSPGAAAAPSLVHGLGASPGRATGDARVLDSPADERAMRQGEILVTHMTSPDWVPLMRRAAAIVTEVGGMTSHAAIVARELGVPCIVGARDATRLLPNGTLVTVDGSTGIVTAGSAQAPGAAASEPSARDVRRRAPPSAPVTATRLYVNLGEPSRAAEVAALDVDGVGLLRAEFMMLEALEHMHPRAFLSQRSPDEFVRRMADGLRQFASAFHPRPVVYRAMDFRSNEFRNLAGGAEYEPTEANPMIGYRGCFRYTREPDLFDLELRALATVRRDFDNLHLMLPFVRTAHELEACLRLVDASALGADRRLERWVMAEVPSVVYWLPRYAALGITGVSIGSNDLTQLMLGVDRDSELFGSAYDERDPAVLHAIESIIGECRRLALTCSICGQAPSVHAAYAEQLVRWGIHSMSVNVDAIDRTRHNIAAAEQRLLVEHARAGSTSIA